MSAGRSDQSSPPDRMLVVVHHKDPKMDLTWLHESLPDVPRTVYESNWKPSSDAEAPPQHRTANSNGKEGQVRRSIDLWSSTAMQAN